jgi:hypothetical protein
MKEGSAIDRLSQGMSRNMQRGVSKIGPVGFKVLQWLSGTGRGGLARLRAVPRRLERKNWLPIVGLLVSVVSAFYTYRTVVLTTQSLKQHLDPELGCSLGNIHDKFPLFSLVNEGQIAAESVIIDHLIFFYEIQGEKIGKIKASAYEGVATFPSKQLSRPGAQWVYASKLEPNQHTPPKKTAMFSYAVPNKISILFFKITYLRPTDGKRYEKRCFFYRESDHHYQKRTTFESNPHFAAVNAEIDRYLGKDPSWWDLERAAEELRD